MSKRAHAKAHAKKLRIAVGRRKGQTSRAIKASAQANGVLGGRPRDRLPEEVITRLGPPPATPKDLRTWNAKLLAEVQWLSVRGEIGNELAASLRANAGALDRALPNEPTQSHDANDDDEESIGPELEAAAGDDDDDGVRVS